MADEQKLLDYLKRVTEDLQQTRRRLADTESRAGEPIAVVGLACRYPGGVGSPDELWDLVVSGGDAVAGPPTDRGWEVPEGAARGAFLYDAADFDPAPFGLTEAEALAMDPQQRLLLETAWEAFERAGIDPASLRGSRTGVFAGLMYHDYASRLRSVPEPVTGYLGTGSTGSIASGRVAYTFGLTGPALTIDTACSSSLVALHLAAQSLRTGETSLALAGGVAVMATPAPFISFADQGGLAHDGRCKSFAAAADGVGWAEGAGLLLLERLSDAQRNSRPVLAVIRGSAINQDGASSGLTAPNGPAQQRVIRDALADARLQPSDVDLVEGHGTGTRLGDPIEAQALLATYGQGRDPKSPLWLGSIKSNIGHTQAAAGAAGVMKMVYAFRHDLMPRSLHVDEPTPQVDWSAATVRLLTESRSWPAHGRPRRAGISSFGISGTNAHVIIEEAPPAVAQPAGSDSVPPPVVLSAATAGALAGQAARLAEHLRVRPELTPAEVAPAVAGSRAALRHRAALLTTDRGETLTALAALAAGEHSSLFVRGVAGPTRVALVFAGQGAQRVGMGRDLYAAYPAFAAALDEVCAAVDPVLGESLREVMFAGPAEKLDQTGFAQPALFAFEVAYARLLAEYGVRPDALLGHSVGELAAAHLAGVLPLATAARLVALRGRLMQALPAGGAMTAVEAGEAEVAELLDGRVGLAAVNGPRSVVVSGDAEAVDAVAGELRARGRRTRRLAVSHAFHSARMEPMLDDFRAAVAEVSFGAPGPLLVSTVTGAPVSAAELADPEHWVRNVRQPVRFADAIAALPAAGRFAVVLEIGPDAVLTPMVEQSLPDDGPAAVTSADGFPATLGRLFVRGVPVEWPAAGFRPLPTYAFDRTRLWLDGTAAPVAAPDDQPGEKMAGPDDWRYRIAWRPFTPDPAALTGAWLILTGPGVDPAEPAALADALAAAGAETVIADEPGPGPYAGVVSLVALPGRRMAGRPSVSAGAAATLDLFQRVPGPLWTLTRGAAAVDIEPPEPIAAQVWGLARVAGLEHPGRWGGLVDLAGPLDDRLARRVVAVLADPHGEDQVALRDSGTYVRRLTRAAATERRTWRPSGTVLITGGTGGIGAHVARSIARVGGAHLLLAGRRGGAAPGVAELLAELGPDAEAVACDVTDRDSLARLLAGIPDDRPLTAVLHAAGLPQYTPIDELDPAALAAVGAGKVLGADHLDDLLHDRDLDTFVLFSSAAAVWGSAGGGGYAAANAHLDALAEARRRRGLRATSVAWGGWGQGGGVQGGGVQGGMVDETGRQLLARQGLPAMDPERAVSALWRAIECDDTCLTVADVDWPRFADTFTLARRRPLIEEFVADQAPAAPPVSAFAARLRDRPVEQARDELLRLVLEEATAVLGDTAREPVVADRAFRDLGFDSMAAVELRNRLGAAAGLRLPATVVFDHPTPRRLADRLLVDLGPGAAPVAALGTAVADPGEPIAIVGMACRYPGGVASPEDLWRLVADGVDAVGPFPPDRGWDLDTLFHPDPDQPATSYAKDGGFLTGAGDFDPLFFGISPREAQATDPQQWLLLETSWEAFERAGINPRTLSGTPTGVFVGGASAEFAGLLAASGADIEGYGLTGTSGSVLSGRIAYTYGLQGPAVTVDTACSSSLVAIHLAMQSLRHGESTLALAGGVTVMATPAAFVEFSKQRGLSGDGRCRSYAASADGTGWGEGVGLLVLERLSDARRNGHRVLGVVRGSAINQDGASNGLTAPNGPAQQLVIRQALAGARLDPSEVDAVEGHGTATTLGDPIEAQALLATYGQGRDPESPLWLGSIKSNIGHTQSAAGVAGVIKMVMAMRHGELPPTLHVDEPTPQVDWSAGAVRLLTGPRPWPEVNRPRRAAVSSFGASGTNAHVILEQAPAPAPIPAGSPTGSPAGSPVEVPPILLTARTGAALRAQAARLAEHLRHRPEGGPAAAFALAARPALEYRAGVDGDDPVALLTDLAEDRAAAGLVLGSAVPGKVVFVFPGQGAQWAGMAADLLDTDPVFTERLHECAAALAGYVDWALLDVVRGDPGAAPLSRVDVVQPVLFAVMLSLAEMWRAAGVRPDAVIGHSQGEIAAAVFAGALSLDDGARVVALRSRALLELGGHGGMGSIPLPEEEVVRRIAGYDGRVSIAGVNGPRSTVVSGEPDALRDLIDRCRADDVRARPVDVDYASHSAQVERLRENLAEVLAPVNPTAGTLPLYSTLTGSRLDTTTMDAGYWYRNLRNKVRFGEAVAAAAADGHRAFVECSPHPVLAVGVRETLDEAEVTGWTGGTLRRDEEGRARFRRSLLEAWAHGVPVDWSAPADAVRPELDLDLPTYPFEHQRYWLAPRASTADVAGAGLAVAGHPLLSARIDLPDGPGVIFSGVLSVRRRPWLADHAVAGAVVLPGTAFVDLVIRAGDHVGCGRLAELTLQAPLVLPPDRGVQLRLQVASPGPDGHHPVEVFGRPDGADGEWTRHAVGRLAPGGEPPSAFDWPPPAEPVDVDGFYEQSAEAGFRYGPAFRNLRAAWRTGDTVYAEVELTGPERDEAAGYGLHPALLDAALHALRWTPLVERAGTGLMPFAWSGVTLRATGATALRVRLTVGEHDTVRVDASDALGNPVLTVESLTMRPAAAPAAADPLADALFRVAWPVVPATGTVGPRTVTLLGPAESALARALAQAGFSVRAADARPETAGLVLAPRPIPGPAEGDRAAEVHRAVKDTLGLIQDWLSTPGRESSTLVFVTESAIATAPGEDVRDLVSAALWGLVRSAQTEHPGRFRLLDLEPGASAAALTAALHSAEPQAAVRSGEVRAPRLARPDSRTALALPDRTGPWRVDASGDGTLEGVGVVPFPEAAAPLAAGQVRVELRAAGVNFRDVAIALGMVPDQRVIGSEGAGVVVEVGAGVTRFAVGDRVLGLFTGSFAPRAVAEQALLTALPANWSFEQGASVPIAFLTAYYGLRDLGGLREGESVLIHAAAGGVGMAALQLARHWGAEVYATASEPKWPVLRGLGVEPDHIASSRTLDFEDAFRATTAGAGVDVVLDSLAGSFVDASLRLLPRGGRFIEMGKSDRRDAAEIAAGYPGVRYRIFDLSEAGVDRLGEMLTEVMALFAAGRLRPLPIEPWHLSRARGALRHLSQARHVGKLVLTTPATPDPDGTVLITGGTGTLGVLLARHLVTTYGVRHLVLAGRRGAAAEGAEEAAAGLRELGAEVRLAACDVADRDALAALLAEVPPEHPLTGVVHAAGVLDDSTVATLTGEQVDRVLRPKVDAALHLHELTADRPLAMFVLFSSTAGVLGGAGQANYAAAGAFLDAIAQHRHATGRAGLSLAWGLWEQRSSMTGHLDDTDVHRLTQQVITPLTEADGMRLFDAALLADESLLVPIRIDVPALRRGGAGAVVPAMLRGLVPAARPRAAGSAVGGDGTALATRLAAKPAGERRRALYELIRSHAAAVLGDGVRDAVEPDRPFKDLGFDSLTAVELRNRLATATGLRLPATLVFDHPTPAALITRLLDDLDLGAAAAAPVEAVRATDEPIAIVGMSGRFPGGVTTPEELWRLVADGVDAVRDIPADRGWDLDRLYDENAVVKATGGGFLDDVAGFDAAFFGISPREATMMDPQQRLLLETAWEALERAGIDPATVRGSRTGVFVGGSSQDYVAYLAAVGNDSLGHLLSGAAGSVLSGRIAYVLGAEGPTVTVDTACSSSLVALHLAAQSLRSGESTLALAGGVAVQFTPGLFAEFSRQGGLAPDGRCKAFADAADGTGWSEGAGLLVLERLSDARRNGRRILAVVRGSAVNQDGASNGLTAPNGPAQQRVIRQALAAAGLQPAEVDAVEAHGTGTTLGDPIEAQALLATYGRDRDPASPLWLGSIKSNIGHSQAAAGVAGVMKMVQALRHDLLPPTLHADRPSSQVDWSAGTVRLLTEARAWPRGTRPRRAGVSSFGISGTNAHVVLEEAPAEPPAPTGAPPAEPPTLLLSARSAGALAAQARRLHDHLREHPELEPAAVARGLLAGRAQLRHRAAVRAGDRDAALAGLAGLAAGRPAAGTVRGVSQDGPLAVVFPGQGAQRHGMGRALYERYPVFRAALDELCDELAAAGLPGSLLAVMTAAADERLDTTEYAQPALFAYQVALYRLLESFGVRADLLAGHSVGELVAAHLSGALPRAEACRLVVARGALMQRLPAGGAMTAIGASEDEVAGVLAGRPGAGIAAVNGPRSVVVSGDAEAVAGVAGELARRGRRTRELTVSHAFHSARMEPMLDAYAEVTTGLPSTEPEITMISTVTGAPVGAVELAGPAHWRANVRRAVRFADAVRALVEAGATTILEVGPDAVLSSMVHETVEADGPGRPPAVVATARSGSGDPVTLLDALAGLHVAGARVDWAAVLGDGPSPAADLPTYPFQHQHLWPVASGGPARADVAGAGLGAAGHPLLGAVLEQPESGGITLTGALSVRTHPWLADHAVAGTTLLPGTAFAELLVRAGDAAGCDLVDELVLEAPLLIGADVTVSLQVAVGPADGDGRRTARVFARSGPDAPWVRHATGALARSAAGFAGNPLGQWPPAAEPVEMTGFYHRDAARGLVHGPAFQGLRAVWRAGDDLFAEAALPAGSATGFALHPALLDAVLQAVAVDDPEVGVPFAFAGLTVRATGATAVRARLIRTGGGFRVEVFDGAGRPVAEIGSLALRKLDPQAVTGARPGRWGDLLAPEWIAPGETVEAPPGREMWALVGADGPETGQRLAEGGLLLVEDPDPVGALGHGVARHAVLPVRPDARIAADIPAAVHAECARLLKLLQDWVAAEVPADSRLVVLTERALAVRPGEDVAGLAGAAVHGLVRTAQAEHPGRIVLVDVDDAAVSAALIPLATATAVALDEPVVAIRDGELRLPRLVPVPAAEVPDRPVPDGTVLVVGANGALGGLVARHLVTAHDVRDLLLIGRRGAAAPGADRLTAELTELGARVTWAACDAADPDALGAALAAAETEVTGVVHAGGVLDDGVFGALTPARLSAVLRSKVDAAWQLHRLTADRPLSMFVLFSSMAGLFGSPGQANYAAANAFLDALAAHRRSAGRSALSLAWGPWNVDGGMAARTEAAATGLSAAEGLARFDAALGHSQPLLVPIRAITGARGPVPALLRTVAGARPVARPDAAELRDVLAGRSGGERLDAVRDVVRTAAAAVLGHPDATAIADVEVFAELGFDSLMSIELRNQLAAATGVRLTTTLVFDYPTVTGLAAELIDRLIADLGPAARARVDDLDEYDGDGTTLAALYRRATELGEYVDGTTMLELASRFRPSFRTPEESTVPAALIRLCAGPADPPLICLPSPTVFGGPHEYTPLATALRGVRDVWSPVYPGFVAGERLPADFAALADFLAAGVLARTDGKPCTIVGRSSGGTVAHLVVARLEELGTRVQSLVLIDTYPPSSAALNYILPVLQKSSLDAEEKVGPMTDVRLTAMAAYFAFFGQWSPKPVQAPTALLRASDLVPVDEPPSSETAWRSSWPIAHTAIDVPGNHFTMMLEQIGTTVEALEKWIRQV